MKINVQMEIIICSNSRVSRYKTLCCGTVGSLYVFFIYL